MDVKGSENCGFHAIIEDMGLTKESHLMIRRTLIQETKDHVSDYMRVFRCDECF